MKEKDPESMMRAVDRLFFGIIGFGFVVFVAFGFLAWYVDSRLDTFESEARYRPPVSDPVSHSETVSENKPIGSARIKSVRGVFVSAYSHIYTQEGQPFRLTVTLSIRNTDPKYSLSIDSVRYFDTSGQLVRSFLDQPLTMAPLGTKEFLVEENNVEGGSGANFIVQWSSPQPNIGQPLIEAVMIGTSGQQGISFVSRGIEMAN